MNTNAITLAMNAPLVSFRGLSNERVPQNLQGASSMLTLALLAFHDESTESTRRKLLAHIRSMISSGNEPCIDCTNNWVYPIVTSAIALAKQSSSVWSQLSEEEIDKLDLIMTLFTIICNYINNDANSYTTGLGRKGDVNKNFSPNFRWSLLGPMIACSSYFGGEDAIDTLLTTFDYDALMEKVRAYNFCNILAVWGLSEMQYGDYTLPSSKDLIELPGRAYIRDDNFTNVYAAGSGQGAKIPFLYKGFRANVNDLLNQLLEFSYSGGKVTSHSADRGNGSYLAHTLNGEVSPLEGQDGMMREFNTIDGPGERLRSDAWYCMLDFQMMLGLLAIGKFTSHWSEDENAELYKKVRVGTSDLMYKLGVGYMGYSLGRNRVIKENNITGYTMLKNCWLAYFAPKA